MKFTINNPAFLQAACVSKINYPSFGLMSLEDGNVFDFNLYATDQLDKLNYSTDKGKTWNEFGDQKTITINEGEYLFLKCVSGSIYTDNGTPYFSLFESTGKFNAVGKISTVVSSTYTTKAPNISLLLAFSKVVDASELILDYEEVPNLGYTSLFEDCNELVKAPELPAMIIGENAYHQMFKGCKKLTQAPKILPAPELSKSCYAYMFQMCEKLEKAPILPARSIVDSAYISMFQGCLRLNEVRCYANQCASLSTSDWLATVSGAGVFVKASDATFWVGNSEDGIPTNWTVEEYVVEQ